METKTKTVYSSMSEIAKALGVSKSSIRIYYSHNFQKPLKLKYLNDDVQR